MTRVSFYTFRDGLDDVAARHWVCRLIHKIAHQAPVWVHVPTHEVDALDSALWTFEPGAFLAHRRVADAHDRFSRVVLVEARDDAPDDASAAGQDARASQHAAEYGRVGTPVHGAATPGTPAPSSTAAFVPPDPLSTAPDDAVLVNLSDRLPRAFARFERIADVVGVSEAARVAGRTRFRFLRERGYPLEHHVLG